MCGMRMDDIEVLSIQMASDILDASMQMRQEDMQMEWERTRWLAAQLLAPHAKKGQRIKPQDLIEFAWDAKPDKLVMDDETKKLVLRHWDSLCEG